jgi:ribosomal protein S18 acetylase RimI-like enzyme
MDDGKGRVILRRSAPADRDAIIRFTHATGFFRPDELDVAAEVLDEALAKGPSGHYQSYTAEVAGAPVGWVCFGPTPCTLGTFDIYWIVTAPERRGSGVGTTLLRQAEKLIGEQSGRIAVAETSGRAEYEPTRQFYLKRGYHEAARVADFYAPGDDKIIYVKLLR